MRKHLVVLALAVTGIACRQTPVAPAPGFQTIDGFFTNGSVQLSYQLTIPAHTAPVGAVIFGHGSGLQDKSSCNGAGVAGGFVQRGYATLCFDKRGVAKSTGQFVNPTPENSFVVFEDLASDIAAGVAFLRSRPEINPNRIGIVGASQAGWIVPLAAQKTKPAFMMLIVAPTISLGLEWFYSSIVEVTNAPVEEGYAALPSFNGLHGFDPKPVLQSIDVPGLWLLGEKDRSIPTPATAAILDELIGSGKPYSYVVYPGVGHTFPPAWPDIDKWLAKIGQ